MNQDVLKNNQKVPESSQRTGKFQQVSKSSNKFQCYIEEPTKELLMMELKVVVMVDNHESDDCD